MWPFKANYQGTHKKTWQAVFRKEAHQRYQSRTEPVDAFPFWEGLMFRSLTPWCSSNCPCFSTVDGKQPSGSRAFRVLQLKHKLQKEWCPKFTQISGTYIKWSTLCLCEGFFESCQIDQRALKIAFLLRTQKMGGTTFFSELSSNIIHLNWLSLICRVGFFHGNPTNATGPQEKKASMRPIQVMMVINNPSIRPYFLGFWHWGVAMIKDVTSDSF